jgi:hypothetical protein
MRWLLCPVFYIPAESAEKGVYEIDPYLRLKITSGEIIILVLFEF